MTTTLDAIRAIIVRDFELPPERLQRDTLLEEIELDSLSITELVFSIEDEFQITAENTIPPFKTLGDIADYVARLVAERDTKPRAGVKAAPVPAKSAAVPAIPSRAAATPAPRRPRTGAKKARSAGNGVPSERGKRSGKAANGSAEKRTNGVSRTNGAKGDGAGRTKAAQRAKKAAAAAPSRDAPPLKPKRAGGSRGGARAR